jgi:SAM-dependent methyltransferase
MKDFEQKEVISKYNERLKIHGDSSPKSLGWDKGNQELRFEVFLKYWEIKENYSILDFGCGFGDFGHYLRNQNINCKYTGVDINKSLINVAKNKKLNNVNFHTIDFLKKGLGERYDLIFSSGVHNIKIDNNISFIEETFKNFYNNSKIGFAINFMSDNANIKYDENYYSNPTKILALAYKFSKRISLINNYMPYEFTIFIDKRDIFDKNTTYAADSKKH